LSSAEPVRPIDWVIPVRQAWAKRCPRQLGVVVGAQREPDTAA
jgi:hypothetical protein